MPTMDNTNLAPSSSLVGGNGITGGGCLHNSQLRQLKPPTAFSKVYKEECTCCFMTPESEEGLNVCLNCFQGGCLAHSMIHYRKTGHCLMLNIKKRIIARDYGDVSLPQAKLVKIEVKSEPAPEYNSSYGVCCLACSGKWAADSHEVQGCTQAIINTIGASQRIEAQAWQEEIITCDHSIDFQQSLVDSFTGQLQDREKCSQCDLRENLWMCLTCGSVGCGRKQYDGSGGHGHGAEHYITYQHPLAVKLGTITPEGGGDVHCYVCNEMRLDPKLNKHLINLGLDVDSIEKTAQTMAELQLEQNRKFDFSMVTDDGHQLTAVSGPGRRGLRNLGNSCYINSVLQSVLHLPPFVQHYASPQFTENHFKTCHKDTPACFICQMAKVTLAMYATEASTITPWMLKAVITNGHPEFATPRQQDAAEFFSYLLKIIQRNDPSASCQLVQPFSFFIQQKLTCPSCGDVNYQKHSATQLVLSLGEILASSPHDNLTLQDRPSLEFFLKRHFEGEIVEDARCPKCHHSSRIKYLNMTCTPQYLIITLSRYILKNWVPHKLEMAVRVPFDELDLQEFIAKEEKETNNDETEIKVEMPVNETMLAELLSMGFPVAKCRKALQTTENCNLEMAMNWILEHEEDAIEDDDKQKTSIKPTFSEDKIKMLMDAGFGRNHTIQALEATQGDVERAFDWILSHQTVDATGEKDHLNINMVSNDPTLLSTRYRLVSFISHKGPSVHCGHYIAHVRDGANDGQWLMFNDDRVVLADPQPPQTTVDQAYLLIYQRIPL